MWLTRKLVLQHTYALLVGVKKDIGSLLDDPELLPMSLANLAIAPCLLSFLSHRACTVACSVYGTRKFLRKPPLLSSIIDVSSDHLFVYVDWRKPRIRRHPKKK